METPGDKELINYKAMLAQVPQKFKENIGYTNPHNMWLGIAIRTGTVGLLFFIFIFYEGIRMCFAGIRQDDKNEKRLTGQLCLCLLILFSIYGLFNPVMMHLLETLLCVLFAIIALSYCETQKYHKGL